MLLIVAYIGGLMLSGCHLLCHGASCMNSLPIEYARLIDATDVAERLHLPKARERHKWACPCCGSSDALHVYPGPGRGSSCYSCGESPDAIGLVMRAGGMKFMDAIRWLAGEFGFSDLIGDKSASSTLDAKRRLRDVQAQIAERERERDRLEVERRYAAYDVWDRIWPMLTLGIEGWEYMEGRAIPYEVAEHCGIRSVATEAAWQNIREQFTDDELEGAGLLGKNSRGAYPVPWRVPFLVIPYFLSEGGIDILRFRDLSGSAPKYLSPLGHRPTTASLDHSGHVLADDYPTLFICEGEIN